MSSDALGFDFRAPTYHASSDHVVSTPSQNRPAPIILTVCRRMRAAQPDVGNNQLDRGRGPGSQTAPGVGLGQRSRRVGGRRRTVVGGFLLEILRSVGRRGPIICPTP